MIGMRIKDYQRRGPEEFTNVAAIRDQCIGETSDQTHVLQSFQRGPLHKEGHHTRDNGEREERKLLQKERFDLLAWSVDLQPLQRPKIKQEQNKRDRDQHGFAYETQGENEQRQSVI